MTEHHNTHENKVAELPKPAHEFLTGEFGAGYWKGFKFKYPEFTTLGAFINHYGEDITLVLANGQLANRIRTHVANSLPTVTPQDENAEKPSENTIAAMKLKEEKIKAHPDGVIFSNEESLGWIPRIREESPKALYEKAQKLVMKAKDIGFDKPEAMVKLQEAAKVIERQQQLQAELDARKALK